MPFSAFLKKGAVLAMQRSSCWKEFPNYWKMFRNSSIAERKPWMKFHSMKPARKFLRDVMAVMELIPVVDSMSLMQSWHSRH